MSLANPYARRTELKLFIRSTLPSAGSFAGCLIGAIVLMGVHLLFVTLDRPSFPYDTDDPIVQAYNMYVVAPLGNLLHSNMLNTFLVVLFELAAHLLSNLSCWRASKRNITLPQGSDGLANTAPMQRSFLMRLIWQGIVLVVGIAITALCVPVLHFILLNSQHIVHAVSVVQMCRAATVSLLLWMLVLHMYVILLRWYMARTRVFGEILY
jgi:hypothetical protein